MLRVYVSNDLQKRDDFAEFSKHVEIVKLNPQLSVVSSKAALPRQNFIILCDFSELEKYESRSIPVCVYFWQVLEYIKTPSFNKGSYRFTGFATCRIALHAHFKNWTTRVERGNVYTYIHVDPDGDRKDKTSYNERCKVKNSVTAESLDLVCDKSKLYKNLSKYIPETWNIDDFVFNEGPVIVKPAGPGAYSGNGVKVVNTREEFQRAKAFIKTNRSWKGIVSTYIGNPLLFHERKFHLRVYMLVTSKNTYSVFPTAHIFTAAAKHISGNYTKEVTDTHGGSTEEDWEYPNDCAEYDLWPKVLEVCAEIWDCIQGKVQAYPESEYGYELIAPDIMFDSNLNPWLLEVNRKVGLASSASTKEKYEHWAFKFYDWLYNEGVQPGL